MSKCQFCQGEVKEWDSEQAGYLVASMNRNGNDDFHTHVHGTIEDRQVSEKLIEAAISETNLGDTFIRKVQNQIDRKEIVFHNRQRIGDILMFTCGVRDFKRAFPDVRVGVISTAMHLWDHNPHVDRTLVGTEENILKIGPGWLTNKSNSMDWHFANAYRASMEQALNINIPQGESRPDIWFTQAEWDFPRITEKPYWIIITGGEKGWGCKMYPTTRWQEVIDQNPDLLFYQLGSAGDKHEKLQGKNVVDYIGKTEDRHTGIRDLFKLFLNAEGSIGLVSFHMHLSGALYKPSVVIAGAREPVSFTRYAGHQYIANDGCLPCAVTACWHCAPEACTNPVTVKGEWMPKCVDMIESAEVSRYIKRYYDGGRLNKNSPIAKPKFKNIVPTPKIVVPVEKPKLEVNTYGMPFGGGSLTDKDWEFILEAIDKHKVKSVLEFGAGLSTLLFNDRLEDVLTYEDKDGWMNKIYSIKPCNIRLWDGKIEPVFDRKYDLCFVDGPSGGASREFSTKIASEVARIVVVHDAGREHEKMWQEKYVQDKFEGPIKGGHRCHLWVRKEAKTIPIPKKASVGLSNIIPIKNLSKKFVKIISTARGWGGCGRSVSTIMKKLLSEGHKVEFIPFRNSVSSREFQECFKNDLKAVTVTPTYNTVKEKCDVLLMYADDYVWEFSKPEVSDWFSNLNADKKIMMANYRRGPIGKAEWTKGWDKYMFLNSTQEKELLTIMPGVKTKVLPPCIELDEFLAMKPDFNHFIRIARHSSQGDVKFAKNFQEEVDSILSTREDIQIAMMPGPTFVPDSDRFKKVTRNLISIPKFLEQGNLFWYSLPVGYADMGPRVIIEAMAVGLPVLADNWGGATDRVTPECGWLCDTKAAHSFIIANLTLKELQKKGEASKQRARDHFATSKWVQEIIE